MRRHLWAALLGLCAMIPAARAAAQSTEAMLDDIQHKAFLYFWNEANPTNGLVKDRSTLTSPSSIAAVGFGLSSICVGIDHGWITRAAGRDRVLTTLQTFWNGPQGPAASGTIGYKGLFYHFLDMNTAVRTWTSELSTIDTALLFAGIVDAKQYFNQGDPAEMQIRALADSIVYRADWNFMRNFNPGILMGWNPEHGFANFGQWIGYNEAMILYILALGSPTHAVPASAWTQWTSGYAVHWQTQYGYTYLTFPPLFGHQYSHCWVDFRSIWDSYMQGKGLTYFENSRRATLAQRAYCIATPVYLYTDSLWGLTASDGPNGYDARGAPPPQNDNGTIAPTAAGGSIAFAPEVCIPALRNMYNAYGPGGTQQLWGPYGFRDAFNLKLNWWDTDDLGIDQGPIVIMIENYLNGSIWSRFMANADIQTGLTRAGFVPALIAVDDGTPRGDDVRLFSSEPNPFITTTAIPFSLPQAARVRLSVYDVMGREVARLVDGLLPAGTHRALLDGSGLPSGAYEYRLTVGGSMRVGKCVRLR